VLRKQSSGGLHRYSCGKGKMLTLLTYWRALVGREISNAQCFHTKKDRGESGCRGDESIAPLKPN